MQPRYNHVAGAMTSDDVPYQVWPRLLPIAPGLFGDTRGDTIWIVGELLDPPSHVEPPLEFRYCVIADCKTYADLKCGLMEAWGNRVELAPWIIGERVTDDRGCVWILADHLRSNEKLGVLDHLEIRRQVEPGVMSVLGWHIQIQIARWANRLVRHRHEAGAVIIRPT
jgi:hypothetical protein